VTSKSCNSLEIKAWHKCPFHGWARKDPCGLVFQPIYFVNTINDAAALLLARGADFLAAFDKQVSWRHQKERELDFT